MEIEGDIVSPGYQTVPQKTQPEFAVLLQDVLDQDSVLGVGWTQYTPYFNDGDPCVFGVGDLSIAIEGAERPMDFEYSWQEDDADEDGMVWLSTYDEEFVRLIGDPARQWIKDEEGKNKWVLKNDPNTAPNSSLFKAFLELSKEVSAGSFNNVLMGLFGDHAIVRVNKTTGKILIEEYSHD